MADSKRGTVGGSIKRDAPAGSTSKGPGKSTGAGAGTSKTTPGKSPTGGGPVPSSTPKK